MAIAQKEAPHSGEIQKKDILFRKSFVFVLDLIQFTEQLKQKKKKSLAKQLLKSGTTIGNIINEFRFIDNKNDINKIKELNENLHYTKYLLQLCKYSPTYPNPNNLITDLDRLFEQTPKIANL